MKKLISLMLAVLMLFSCVSVATASAAYTDGEHLPQVYVEGLESKGVYYIEDKDQENPLFFPIDGNMMITKLTENYEEKLKKAFLAQDSDAITAYLTDWIMDCFGDIALGKDGFTMSDKVYVPETELDPLNNTVRNYRLNTFLRNLTSAEFCISFYNRIFVFTQITTKRPYASTAIANTAIENFCI